MFWSKKKEETEPAPESSDANSSGLGSGSRTTTDTSPETKEIPAHELQDQQAPEASGATWGSRLNTAKQLYSTANQVYTVASALPQAKAALDPYLSKTATTENEASAEATTESTGSSKEPGDSPSSPAEGSPGTEKENDADNVEDPLTKAPNATKDESVQEHGTAASNSNSALDSNAAHKDTTDDDSPADQDTKPAETASGLELGKEDEDTGEALNPADAMKDEAKIAEFGDKLGLKSEQPAEASAEEDSMSKISEIDDEEAASKGAKSATSGPVREEITQDASEAEGEQDPGQEEQSKATEPEPKDVPSAGDSADAKGSKDIPTSHSDLVAEEKAPTSNDNHPSPGFSTGQVSAPKDAPHVHFKGEIKGDAPNEIDEGEVSDTDVPSEPLRLVDNDPIAEPEEVPAGSAPENGKDATNSAEISKEEPEEQAKAQSSEDTKLKPIEQESKSDAPAKPDTESHSDPANKSKSEAQPEATEKPAPVDASPEATGDDPIPVTKDSKPASTSRNVPAAEPTEDDSTPDETPHKAKEAGTNNKDTASTSLDAEPEAATANATQADGQAPAPEAQAPNPEEIERAADAAKAAARLQSTADALWDQARAVRDPAERERLWRAAYNKEVEAHGQSKKARAMASGWGQGALSGVGVSAALGIGLGNVVGALLGSVVSLPGSLVGAGVGAAMGPLVKLGVMSEPKKGKEQRPKEFDWEEDMSDDEEHQRIVDAIRMDEEAAEGK